MIIINKFFKITSVIIIREKSVIRNVIRKMSIRII